MSDPAEGFANRMLELIGDEFDEREKQIIFLSLKYGYQQGVNAEEAKELFERLKKP